MIRGFKIAGVLYAECTKSCQNCLNLASTWASSGGFGHLWQGALCIIPFCNFTSCSSSRMRENWSALYHGGLDKVYSVYSEYTLKFGFVWKKNCTVRYIFGIMWTFDIIMICVVEVLSYNSWIKRKYEIFTFLIMTFVQPHWNVLHAIGFSFLLRISRGHIHKKMSFWWTMYTRPPAPLKYAPVYMYEDFYLSWILRDRWCLQNLFNRALTWKYFLRHIKASTAKVQSISE